MLTVEDVNILRLSRSGRRARWENIHAGNRTPGRCDDTSDEDVSGARPSASFHSAGGWRTRRGCGSIRPPHALSRRPPGPGPAEVAIRRNGASDRGATVLLVKAGPAR